MTDAPTPETVIELRGGATIRTDAHTASPTGSSYVRVCAPDGTETAYWSDDEWAAAPREVMGALLGAARSLTPPVPAPEVAVAIYRKLTHDARIAYLDDTLPNQTARNARTDGLRTAADRMLADLPADLAALLRHESDLLTVAYEETMAGCSDTEITMRTTRALAVADQITAYLTDRA